MDGGRRRRRPIPVEPEVPAQLPCGPFRRSRRLPVLHQSRRELLNRLAQVMAFKAELIQLAKEGIVLEEATLERIRAHHGALLAGTPDERLSLGMRVASTVGATALSAAIFFLFYRFWGALSTPGQVALLIAVPVVLVLLTDRL